MKNSDLILKKGESINFLDYIIKNSLNNDGLVLFKEKGKSYETHLGNYGTGTLENINSCKTHAILYFMVARPEIFATTLVHKLRRKNSGTMHEFFLLKRACEKEEIQLPPEISAGDGINCMIYFNNKPLSNRK